MSQPTQSLIQRLEARFISSLIVHFRINEFECRGLTQGEVEIAQQVFGNLINYAQVKIFNIPYLPWQPVLQTHLTYSQYQRR